MASEDDAEEALNWSVFWAASVGGFVGALFAIGLAFVVYIGWFFKNS
jgi:hypothetical protein